MVDYSDIVYNTDKLRLLSQYSQDPSRMSPAGRQMAENHLKEMNGYVARANTAPSPKVHSTWGITAQQLEQYLVNKGYNPDSAKAMGELIIEGKPLMRDPHGFGNAMYNDIVPNMKNIVAEIKSGKVPKPTLGQMGKTGANLMKGAFAITPATITLAAGQNYLEGQPAVSAEIPYYDYYTSLSPFGQQRARNINYFGR